MKYSELYKKEELVLRISESNVLAFDQLFIAMHPALCLFANRIVANEAAAKDIVSEIFLQLWKNREALNEVKNIEAYLYTATRNRSLNHLRKSKREGEKEGMAAEQLEEKPAEDILQEIFNAEVIRTLHEAIKTLPPECTKVVQMGIEGFSTNEIALRLGVSASAVSHQKARAIRLLREKIAPGIALITLLLAD
ncbi:RNA polymerase sigma-70 factor [Filimonas effusa]|uniref:RNA polymerase sigma-70 factor n=1 Tax=Filimonas effusa TaxID=2508721 RepID=A0A4Q1D2C2_9BACT|nr:RNA polymerase sigma-70 factor [Filimonas effusa]RXK81934.1 RNA polymerase sigma-70 factor [Filimonas effusa]